MVEIKICSKSFVFVLGRTSEGGALPSVVQHVEVPILSLNQCRNMKYRSSRITPNMVCAGKGKQDSCQVSRFILKFQFEIDHWIDINHISMCLILG